MGSVYSRKRSPYLWIKYHQHGRVVRESTGTKNETVARRMLRTREGDVERGIPIDPKVGRITFDEAVADLLNDYKANRKRTYVDAKRRIQKHLAPFFGNRRMITITTAELRAFVAKRLADGTPARQKRGRRAKEEGSPPDAPRRPVSAGEINRELTVLKRMFSNRGLTRSRGCASATTGFSAVGSMMVPLQSRTPPRGRTSGILTVTATKRPRWLSPRTRHRPAARDLARVPVTLHRRWDAAAQSCGAHR